MDETTAKSIAKSLERIADALEKLIPAAESVRDAIDNSLGIPVAVFNDEANPLLVKRQNGDED